MLLHYLKLLYRLFERHKLFAFINLFGLTAGIATAVLMILYVQYESGYDQHFDRAGDLYRIYWQSENPQTRTPHPMAQAIAEDFPEVEEATSLSPIWGPGLTRPLFSVRYEDTRYDERGIFSADSTFFNVFSLDLVRGDREEALRQPGGVVITREMARKYFGGENPMGKTLRLNEQLDLTVTGVMEDIPPDTHFDFDFLISYVTLKPFEDGAYYTWSDFGHFNYLLLRQGADAARLESRLAEWSTAYINWDETDRRLMAEGSLGFRLQPVTDIHLRSDLRWELQPNGNMAYIYIFSGAALFILGIAGINFMNLTTARSMLRAKEVGLRKAVGAMQSQLRRQFLGEAVAIVLLTLLMALVAVDLALPWFNRFAGIQAGFGPEQWPLFLYLLAGGIVLGLISGMYPAAVLSRFKPTRVLKGAFSTTGEGVLMRRGLVVVQFAVSLVLVAGTLVIYKQLNFMEGKDLGFDKEQILVLPLRNQEMRSRYETVRDRLDGVSGVERVSAASNLPGGAFNRQNISWDGSPEPVQVAELRAGYRFVETMGIELAEGRTFSRQYGEDLGASFLINEAAARRMDRESAVGREVTFHDDERDWRGTIVGIVKDFHFQSLHQAISPLLVQVLPEEYNYVLVRLSAQAGISNSMASIETIWKDFSASSDFEYWFLDAEFDSNYRSEQKAGTLLLLFSLLAISMACLGLFGMTSFAVQRRLKEIGIRKVLGARVRNIVGLFSWEVLLTLGISVLIALPLAVWLSWSWLQNFAYQAEIGAGLYLLSVLLLAVVALATVIGLSLRAAAETPIQSLRSD